MGGNPSKEIQESQIVTQNDNNERTIREEKKVSDINIVDIQYNRDDY